MKLLSTSQLEVILGRVSEELIELAQARLPGVSGPENWLVDGVKCRAFEHAYLCLDGKRIAILFFFINREKGLVATGTVSLVNFDVAVPIEAGWLKIAKERGCRYIECVTIRPGGVRKLESLGYKPVGVLVRKPIL